MGRNVWGFWDCNYCDNKHIRGDNDSCPSCGHRRDAAVKFYMDMSNIVEVSADKKNDKPNWICAFCGSQNDDKDQQCVSCGSPKNSASGDYFHRKDDPRSSSFSTPIPSSPLESSSFLSTRAARVPFRKIAKIALPLLLAVAVIISVVAFVSWFNTPVEKQLTVDSVSWTRSIDIEELRTYNESGWSLPSDARLSYTRREIRTYRDVLDHYETKTRQVSERQLVGYKEEVVGYEDLGNGQFREKTRQVPEYTTVYRTETYEDPVYRKEPVYDTKYYYEIDRWKKSRSVDTSGSDKSPYWGEVVLHGKERQAQSHESYYISGIVGEKTEQFALNRSDWDKYNIGDVVFLVVKRGNNEVISVK